MSRAAEAVLLVRNGRVIAPGGVVENGAVLVRGRRIERLLRGAAEADAVEAEVARSGGGGAKVIDARGAFVSPGFVDIHCHGGGGHDFMDGTAEAFVGAGRLHLRHGTTCLYPTTLASSTEALRRAISAFGKARGGDNLPEFPGLHLEGPYFSPAQLGAQDPRWVRDPEPAEYEAILEGAGLIARWTMAPERPGAIELGRKLAMRGILPAIGHSDADYECVLRAFEAGFGLITHLYSAMSTVHRVDGYRRAGVVESAFLIDDMAVELIADGSHLPSSLLRLVCKFKRPDKICLVTDAMRAAGLAEGEYGLGPKAQGLKAVVRDGVAWMPDGKAFAGSVATADRLVATMVRLAGLSVERAVELASASPAKAMGIYGRKGSLEPGKDADIVVFDDDVRVKTVVARGRIVE